MWGFLSGTLALIVLQTLVQPAAADKLASGSGVLVSALSRLLSEGVAGLPRTKAAKKAAQDKKAGGTIPQNIPGLGGRGQTGAPGPNASPAEIEQWAKKLFG